MNFEKSPNKEVEKKSGVGKWLKKNAALAGAIGVGYLGGLNNSQAQEQKPSPEGGKTNITHVEVDRKNTNSNPKVENIEQTMKDNFVVSLNGAPSEIVKDMLKDALAQEFPDGIPATIGEQKVQLVFNLRIEDREKSEYGTVNASATLRWEVKDSKGSLVKRGAAVDVTGPAAFNVSSARKRAVSSALKGISPQIKILFELKK